MKLLRLGLGLLFAFAVLAFGSNDVWAGSTVEIVAALLFILWVIHFYRSSGSAIQWSLLNWPLLGFAAVGALQIVFRGTAYAYLTRLELLRLAAYFFVFFLLAQVFRTRKDFTTLAWFIVLLAFAVSLFGIVQYFTSAETIYWNPRFRIPTNPFGPYPNRNDFAGFVELTLPTGLGLMMFRGVSKELFPIMTILTVVPISAIVLTGSRGGIVTLVCGLGTLALLGWKSRAIEWKSWHMVAAIFVALAAVTLVAWLGYGKARERFSHLNANDISVARRMSMARGAWHIFLDHPLKGCGLGTIASVYPRYETIYDGRIVNHVHDDYLEALAETGILGGVWGLIFLWLLFREARKNFQAEQSRLSRAVHAGGIAAVTGILVHSFVEFNLHIPANALLFVLQTYLATAPPMTSESSTLRSSMARQLHARRQAAPISPSAV
jgi:O-antigen ligase